MKKKSLVWNVYRFSLAGDKVVVYNIFNHLGFADGMQKIIKKKYDRSAFANEVKSELIYHFCGKYQHEITISKTANDEPNDENEILVSHYPRYSDSKYDMRIDVYEQVMLNFDAFIDYIYKAIYRE